ncbi:MAG TPA: hypothetical protein VE690_08090 [Rhodopila sp.]|nr:hypothetical protein [Rhodopila sp.]
MKILLAAPFAGDEGSALGAPAIQDEQLNPTKVMMPKFTKLQPVAAAQHGLCKTPWRSCHEKLTFSYMTLCSHPAFVAAVPYTNCKSAISLAQIT